MDSSSEMGSEVAVGDRKTMPQACKKSKFHPQKGSVEGLSSV